METPESVLTALDEAYAELEADNLDAAEARLAEVKADHPDTPELYYLEGQLALAREEPQAALQSLDRAVELDPDYTDAHHLLAVAAELTGDRARMIEHFLRVHELDAAADREIAEEDAQQALQLVEGVAEEVLSNLPEPFRSRLADVPIMVDDRPPRGLVEEGFDPRALGVFDGPGHAERTGPEAPPLPTRILLFWTNLLDIAEDPDALAEEVEITVLNEIAHYFDLDEDQVAELGLA